MDDHNTGDRRQAIDRLLGPLWNELLRDIPRDRRQDARHDIVKLIDMTIAERRETEATT